MVVGLDEKLGKYSMFLMITSGKLVFLLRTDVGDDEMILLKLRNLIKRFY